MKKNKSIHVVFPGQFKDILETTFNEAGKYNILGFDTDISSYAHFILDDETKEYCKTVLISTYYDSTKSFMPIFADTVELAIRIKLARQDLRLVFVFPTFVAEKIEYREYISKLIMTGIYDLHFYQDFEYHHIENWLDNVQQIMDVKEYITNSDIPNFNQQIQVDQNNVELEYTQPLTFKEPDQNKYSVDEKEINTSVGAVIDDNESNGVSNEEKQHQGRKKPLFNIPTFSKNKNEEKKEEFVKPPIKSNKTKVSPIPEVQVEKMEMVMSKGKSTKKIGVIGLTKSVGTSFITINFASFLSESNIETGVYENPVNEAHRTYLADHFGFFDEENTKPSLPHAIVNKQEFDRKKTYKIKNMYFYPTNYTESPITEFSTHEIIRYVNTGGHTIKLMDLGHVTELELINNELIDRLSTFDSLIFIVNPLPTKVMPNTKNLISLQQALDTLDIHYVTVLNEYQGELSKSDLKIFDLHKSLEIPSVDHSTVIKAMSRKTTVYDYDTVVRNLLNPYFIKLANQLDLPIQIREHKSKKSLLKMVR